jgi:hypothetical protein
VKRNSFDRNRGAPPNVSTLKPDGKGSHWINFIYLGRKYYSLMLWASTALSHRKWLETIVKRQEAMRERSMIFDTVTLSEGFFAGPNKVNCAAPFSTCFFCAFSFFFCAYQVWVDGGRKVVYGTDDGVYISDLRDVSREPSRVLALLEVSQVDVLEDYQLLIVLSGMLTFFGYRVGLTHLQQNGK